MKKSNLRTVYTFLASSVLAAISGQAQAAENVPLSNPIGGTSFSTEVPAGVLNDPFDYNPNTDYTNWANLPASSLPETRDIGSALFLSINTDADNWWGADVNLPADTSLEFLNLWGRSDYAGAPEPNSEKSRHQGLTISFYDNVAGTGNLLGQVMTYNGISARNGAPGTPHSPGSAYGRFDVALAVPDEADRKLIRSLIIGQDAGDTDYLLLSEVRAASGTITLADPDLVTPATVDLIPTDYLAGPTAYSFSINNAAQATNTLTISNVVPTGDSADHFVVTAFPSSLAPGESGLVEFTFDPMGGLVSQTSQFVITSNDSFLQETNVRISAPVIVAPPASLEFLPDPVICSASSEFSGAFTVTNLFDQNPTPADIENPTFDSGSQFAGQGGGEHVIVCDYDTSVTFDSLAYAQRLGGNPALDKVSGLEIWVSDTDPGVASTNLPILAGAPAAVIEGINTTDSLLRFYPLGTILTGRYVVIRLNAGNGNTGGSELQLSLTGPLGAPEIISIDYTGGDVRLSWNSLSGKTYTLRRSPDLSLPFENWSEVSSNISSNGESTTFVDNQLPPGAQRMFYRVRQN